MTDSVIELFTKITLSKILMRNLCSIFIKVIVFFLYIGYCLPFYLVKICAVIYATQTARLYVLPDKTIK